MTITNLCFQKKTNQATYIFLGTRNIHILKCIAETLGGHSHNIEAEISVLLVTANGDSRHTGIPHWKALR